MYEHRQAQLISRKQFARRMASHVVVAGTVIVASLVIGVVGFEWTEPSYSWLDAYVNAAMLLGGMGQVGPLTTPAGKVFAGTYALYAGLVVIVVTGLLLAPLLHRMMHRFHLLEKDEN